MFFAADNLAILVNKEIINIIEKEMKKHGCHSLFPDEKYPQFGRGYNAVSFCDQNNYVIEIYTLQNKVIQRALVQKRSRGARLYYSTFSPRLV